VGWGADALKDRVGWGAHALNDRAPVAVSGRVYSPRIA
jgi:hypothetical protein